MDSAKSEANNRQGNGTENDDDCGSCTDETSPSDQSRSGARLKKWKRNPKRGDSGSDGDESVGKRIIGSCNSDSRDLSVPELENCGDEDLNSDARDMEVSHVTGDEDEDAVGEDPLTEYVHTLKVLEGELQQEIKKFREIGNESFSPDDSTKFRSAAEASVVETSSVDLRFHDSCSSSSQSGKQISSSFMELQVLSLTEKLNILESQLEELQGELALKNSRIAELELALTCDEFPKDESSCTICLLDEKFKELESEFESLFQEKIEAEVKYVTIKNTMQKLKVASALVEKQETMYNSKVQIPNKLEVAGNEDPIMTNRTEETFMIQSRLCKLTCYFFFQLIMFLMLVLWLVSKLVPNSEGVVPT
ncbi:WPP domain-interacting protein 1-like isoform X1 [Vicia villosa]|uniref:WPP domain-interacting protein 1-like isoform X1 n=1 Tax=Vicia villosa TaxID=3911 RepID=UPI00273B2F17|nr:WPP domain-interacting protein 1-like isoform X1 [Vicia villosa]